MVMWIVSAMWGVAQASEGVQVAVKVLDPDGRPIPTAVVRHPEEKERHRVNIDDGTWRGDAVYLENGSEILFQKNMELIFEVSAPGYKNQRVPYLVRKRKNVVEVTLQKLDLSTEQTEDDDPGPVIGFKHDKPID